jgi:hypothetical protein
MPNILYLMLIIISILIDRYKDWEPYTGPIPVGMSPVVFYSGWAAVS